MYACPQTYLYIHTTQSPNYRLGTRFLDFLGLWDGFFLSWLNLAQACLGLHPQGTQREATGGHLLSVSQNGTSVVIDGTLDAFFQVLAIQGVSFGPGSPNFFSLKVKGNPFGKEGGGGSPAALGAKYQIFPPPRPGNLPPSNSMSWQRFVKGRGAASPRPATS